MERIQGLKEYVQTEHYLEGIGIGKEEQKEIQITYQPLAQGEYNINYWFVHPLTGKKLVLRVNTGSQMHLENQIEYEYHALELLADSGRTPVPVFVDGSKKELPYGVMVMEFLEGSALDYRKNLMEAAECLADIHSVPVKETDGLISPSNPLQAILDASSNAKVEVSGEVFAGTKICIGDVSMVVKNSMKFCKFVKQQGDVKMTAL